MRNPFLLAVAVLMAVALPNAHASAKGLVISSGREGGTYFEVASGLRAVMRYEHGTALDVRTSRGSLENLALLDDPASTVALALTQVDALKYYIDENPGFADDYVEIADVGKECVFIVVPRTSGFESATDLKAEGKGAIAVGLPGSGAAVTWEYMNRIEPAFRRTPATDLDIIEALLSLRQTSRPSGVKAAMLVQRPVATGTPLAIVLDQRDHYAFVPVRAGDIGPSALDDGRAVYSFEPVTIGFGRDYQESFDTLCTHALLIGARSKLSEEQLGMIVESVTSARPFIAPGTD